MHDFEDATLGLKMQRWALSGHFDQYHLRVGGGCGNLFEITRRGCVVMLLGLGFGLVVAILIFETVEGIKAHLL